MPLFDDKNAVLRELAAQRTLKEGFPKIKKDVSASSMNKKTGAIDFVQDVLKIVAGVGVMREIITLTLSRELPKIEEYIKNSLKCQLKDMINCSNDPAIPNYLINSGSGLDISLKNTDYFGVFFIDPTSIAGKLIYTDSNAGLTSKDMHTFLFAAIQDGTPQLWGSQTMNDDIIEVKFTSAGTINNMLNIKASSGYTTGTLSQFNNDYIDSLTLLPAPQIFNQLIDTIFGSISAGVKFPSNTSALPTIFGGVSSNFSTAAGVTPNTSTDFGSMPANANDITTTIGNTTTNVGNLTNSISNSTNSINTSISAPFEMLKRQEEFNKIIENLIQIEEDIIIDDSFFEFDSQEIYDIEEIARNRSQGIRYFQTCDSTVGNVSFNNIIASTFSLESAVGNKVELEKEVSNVINSLSLDISANAGATDKFSFEIELFDQLFKAIYLTIANVIMSPKLSLLLQINHRIVYGALPPDIKSPVDFIKYNKTIFRGLMKVIKNILLSILIKEAIKAIQDLIMENKAKDLAEQAKLLKNQLMSLLGISPALNKLSNSIKI